MTVEEFYKEVDGNYEEIYSQLGDDETITIFLKKFIAKDGMIELKSYINKKKYHDAFICVHNMKGYGLNMALPILHKAASVLCEQLRNGEPTIDITPLVDTLNKAYEKVEKCVGLL